MSAKSSDLVTTLSARFAGNSVALTLSKANL